MRKRGWIGPVCGRVLLGISLASNFGKVQPFTMILERVMWVGLAVVVALLLATLYLVYHVIDHGHLHI